MPEKKKQVKRWRGYSSDPKKCSTERGFHKGCFGNSDYILVPEVKEKK